MKELSIEEKAKRYDEAIKQLRTLMPNWENLSYNGKTFLQDLVHIIPELKESEDERIRKAIGYAIGQSTHSDGILINGVSSEEALAWLERQGKNNMGISEATKQKLEDNLNKALEQETPESWNKFLYEQSEQKPVFEMKTPEESLGIDSDTYNKIVDECIYGEQKSSWSEEDEENLNWFEKFFRPESLITKCKDIPQDRYLWFKSLKDRVQPQPKQEWSEDTQQWIDAIIFDYESWYDADKDHRTTIQAKINILKSLKERYNWKPSELQIEALGSATENCAYSEYQDCLRELIGQLKKLREE